MSIIFLGEADDEGTRTEASISSRRKRFTVVPPRPTAAWPAYKETKSMCNKKLLTLAALLTQLVPYRFCELSTRMTYSVLLVGKVYSTLPFSQILYLILSLTLTKAIGDKLGY